MNIQVKHNETTDILRLNCEVECSSGQVEYSWYVSSDESESKFHLIDGTENSSHLTLNRTSYNFNSTIVYCLISSQNVTYSDTKYENESKTYFHLTFDDPTGSNLKLFIRI